MKISILIASYNNNQFLEDCFQSLKDQTFKDFEVVFLDDCSCDNSIEVAKQLSQGLNIKIYQNEHNKGCGFTKHRLIELSNSQYFAFLDPDDTLEPIAIETMINIMEQHKNLSFAYSYFNRCNIDLSKKTPYPYNYKIEGLSAMMISPCPNHFAIFSREKYNQTVGINPDFKRAVDRDLTLKAEEVGDVIKVEKFLYNYRINENSISNNQNAKKAEYWTWKARFDACDRRGLCKEEVFSKIENMFQVFDYSTTIDFKLGKAILTPLRKIKRLFKK